MPELPDIETYAAALRRFLQGRKLQAARIASPFLLRTFDPPLEDALGKSVAGIRTLGKRIVWEMEEDLFLVFHLMIAGRFRKRDAGVKLARKTGLAAFDFDEFSVLLTEASQKKRASLCVVRGEDALAEHDPGGKEVAACTIEEFAALLTQESHTLKRTLTDPHVFSGIGNAFSDEILWAAQLSPIKWTSRLADEEIARLFEAAKSTLVEWTERRMDEVGDGFPEKVTAFHPRMAVHGKYQSPCPRCGDPVQRIVRAENEINYCATCQTDGKLLADRSLSRLLKGDWPRTLEELEERRGKRS